MVGSFLTVKDGHADWGTRERSVSSNEDDVLSLADAHIVTPWLSRRCRLEVVENTWRSSVAYSRLQLASLPRVRLPAFPLGSVATGDYSRNHSEQSGSVDFPLTRPSDGWTPVESGGPGGILQFLLTPRPPTRSQIPTPPISPRAGFRPECGRARKNRPGNVGSGAPSMSMPLRCTTIQSQRGFSVQRRNDLLRAWHDSDRFY